MPELQLTSGELVANWQSGEAVRLMRSALNRSMSTALQQVIHFLRGNCLTQYPSSTTRTRSQMPLSERSTAVGSSSGVSVETES